MTRPLADDGGGVAIKGSALWWPPIWSSDAAVVVEPISFCARPEPAPKSVTGARGRVARTSAR